MTEIPTLDESANSSFYEQLVEHTFISELLQEACFRYGSTIEVLRSEVDAYGYDLVLEYKGFIRHVQLKTSKPESSTKSQSVSLKLTQKQNWCVVWIKREKPEAARIALNYIFFGATRVAGTTQMLLPSIEENAKTIQTRKGKDNIKAPREGHRKVGEREFLLNGIMKMEQLFKILFPEV